MNPLQSDNPTHADGMGSHASGGLDAERLRHQSVRGGAVTMAAQASKFILTVGATAVLARILEPADFGLFAMVTAVTNIIARLKDMGLTGATIQRAEISHSQISTLFWVNALFGVLLAAVTVLCAPLIAWVYGRPELIPVTAALAGTFVLGGLAVQHLALLRRRMRFGAQAAVEVVALATGIVVAVVAARAGWRHWSLVFMQLANAAALLISVWLVCRWRPGLPRRGSGVRSMLAFGGNLTAVELLLAMSRQADKLLLGWRCGAGALGYYSKAYQLLLLPIQQISLPITNVAITALSRLQHDPERFRSFYRQALQITAALGMPLVVLMFVAAEDVVLTVLGNQWHATVPLFRLLAPAALIGVLGVATAWLYVALNQTHRQLRWTIISSSTLIVAVLIGLRWGPRGVATAFSLAVCALWLPGVAYCMATVPVRIRDVIAAVWRPAGAAIAAGGLLHVYIVLVVPDWPRVLDLGADVVVYGVAYCVCWLLVPRGPSTMKDIISLLPLLRGREA